MAGEFWSGFAIIFAVVMVFMVVLWIFSTRIGDPSFIDAFWSIGFVIIAITSAVIHHGDGVRTVLLEVLTGVWGLRLGGYLFYRWRKNGPDPRYVAMLERNKGSKNVLMLRKVFIRQGLVMCVVSLPLQLGMLYSKPVGWTPQAGFGVALAMFGIAIESIADTQLLWFKRKPSNKGQVMDAGLWRYSRHPNYFGEACTWWGIYLVAVVNLPTFFGFIGPLLITLFLVKWSGIGPLERQLASHKPGYSDYVARTSAFLPRLPKAVAEASS